MYMWACFDEIQKRARVCVCDALDVSSKEVSSIEDTIVVRESMTETHVTWNGKEK